MMFNYIKIIKLLVISSAVFSLLACSEVSNDNKTPTTQVQLPVLELYKSPTCACCGQWAVHIKDNNFQLITHNQTNLSTLKTEKAIPPRYQSCHTAISEEGFVFEGHVPAKYIQQFIKEKPVGAIGLTVSGMPIGTPGMEVGEEFNAYDVLQLNHDGSVTLYAKVNSIEEQY